MRDVILYTDNDSFAGCENMLSVLINSQEFRRNFSTKLIYRESKLYTSDIKARLLKSALLKPLKLLVFRRAHLPKLIKNNLYFRILFRLFIIITFPICFITNFFLIYLCLRDEKKDIIIINNGGYPGAPTCLQAAIIARIVGFNKIYMIVNNISEKPRKLLFLLEVTFDKLVVKSTDLFISGSDAASNALKFNRNVPGSKVTTLLNGIDCKRFDNAQIMARRQRLYDAGETIVFSMIGLHEQRKGHLVLFKAVKNLLERRLDLLGKFKVVIEGHGDLTPSFEEFVLQNDLTRVIEFRKDIVGLDKLYAETDVLVHPSVSSEDLPNVISEALLFGIPVIGSRLAGIPTQVIPEFNGFLFQPGDVSQLSELLERVLDATDTLGFLSANSVEVFTQKFSSQISVEKYISLLPGGAKFG